MYFAILVKIFMNHILAENIFQEPKRVNKTQDYHGLKTWKCIKSFGKDLNLKAFLSTISFVGKHFENIIFYENNKLERRDN